MADGEGGIFTYFGSYVVCECSVGAEFVDQDLLPVLCAIPYQADQVEVGDTRNGSHLRGGGRNQFRLVSLGVFFLKGVLEEVRNDLGDLT